MATACGPAEEGSPFPHRSFVHYLSPGDRPAAGWPLHRECGRCVAGLGSRQTQRQPRCDGVVDRGTVYLLILASTGPLSLTGPRPGHSWAQGAVSTHLARSISEVTSQGFEAGMGLAVLPQRLQG